MIKVLFLLPELSTSSGIATYAMNYYRIIDRKKYLIDFAVWYDNKNEYYDEIINNGDNVFLLPSVFRLFTHFKACRDILLRGNYDIIHDNNLILSIPIMTVARKKGIKIRILHSHSSTFGNTRIKALRNKIFYPALVRTATDFAACSRVAGDKIFIGNNNYNIIPNIVDDKRFKFSSSIREKTRDNYGVKDNIRIIGTIANFNPLKNPLFAIDVMDEYISRHPNTEYWWIGGDVKYSSNGIEISRYVEKKKNKGKIKLLGIKKDIPELLNLLDAFFLPSLKEGLPFSCVEAQAAGLPCIISDEITKEVDFSGLVKFVSLKDDFNMWETALNTVIDNREIYVDVLSKSDFSRIKNARVLEKYYDMLLMRK